MSQISPNNRYFQKLILFLFKYSLLIIVLWFVGKSFYSSIKSVDWTIIVFQPIFIFVGSIIIICSFYIGALGLQYIYRHLDEIRLSWLQSFVLLSVPPLGKYLPSKFFALAGQAVIAKVFGIRVMVSGSVALLIMGFGLTSATLIGMVLLLFQQYPESWTMIFQGGAIGMMIMSTILILKPDLYWQIMNMVLRIFKQTPILFKVHRKTTVVLFFLILFQNGLYLLGVSIIAAGTVGLPVSVFPVLVGANCLANVAGFLAIFAPAGIGVREGILLVLLTPVAGTGIAALVAVMMRVVQTVSDCILGLTGLTILHLLKNKIKKSID